MSTASHHAAEKILTLPQGAFGELLTAELTPQVQVQFPYNINGDLVSTTVSGSGAVTQANAMAVCSTGAATSSSANLESRFPVRYNVGQGGLSRFTALFTTGVEGSVQEIGIGTDDNGYFITMNGDTLSINRRSNGSDNYVPQTQFSENRLDGKNSKSGQGFELDPTKLNVFAIRFQFLGGGEIQFLAENPETGHFMIFHKIKYANSALEPSVYNPTMHLRMQVENTTNDTNVVLKSGSLAGFTEGKDPEIGTPHSHSNEKSILAATETAIFSIRGKATFGGETNHVPLKILDIGSAFDGTKTGIIRLYVNPTLVGSPSWSDIETDRSTVEFDNAATGVTGGDKVFSASLGKVGDLSRDITNLDIKLEPGDIITVTHESTGASDTGASLVWKELF